VIVIRCPFFCKNEIKYILDTIFNDRLNIPIDIVYEDVNVLSIENDNKTINLNLCFFEELHSRGYVDRTKTMSLPQWDSQEVSWGVNLIDTSIPILFGDPNICHNGDIIDIEFDLLGSIFFTLTRYEELNAKNLNDLNQFSASSSLAYRCNFLMRPIVDEYIEILWSAISQLWPSITRRPEKFSIIPTHDVDTPFLNISLPNLKRLIYRLGGDLIKRKSLRLMFRTMNGWLQFKLSGKLRYTNDPYDVFDKLISLGHEYEIKSKYYFMMLRETGGSLYGRYNIYDEEIKALVNKLANEGHEIGMHPTGISYINSKEFISQAKAYYTIKEVLDINCPSGGRQHYLLWSPDTTAINWENSQFDYDSTMGYNEHVGFRAGTCKEYYLWHHQTKRKMKILEKPLIAMDESLLNNSSMGLDYKQARKILIKLKKSCHKMNGNFIFLWHNSSFLKEEDWDLYKTCISKKI
jgi:hypothetical protein